MEIVERKSELDKALIRFRKGGYKIGFVPTMGALHDGHIALIRQCRRENKVTVCSIFVNPTQFDDAGDFANYPVTIEADREILKNEGCDILFLPATEEMYPEGLETEMVYDPGYTGSVLEGRARPGHFDGVITIVHKLLTIVNPDNAYFGQKDYQQYLIIRNMVRDLDLPVSINMVPTVREESGLAMSSRNLHLTAEQKENANKIFQALLRVKECQNNLSPEEARKKGIDVLEQAGLQTEYLEIRDAETLKAVNNWNESPSIVVCVAARNGNVRLIDNILLHTK